VFVGLFVILFHVLSEVNLMHEIVTQGPVQSFLVSFAGM
jgi:hypothetical protein